jgi:hypothetical protein
MNGKRSFGNTSPGEHRVQWAVIVGFAVLAWVIFGRLGHSFWYRIDYGFDLEWMEGGMLVHVDRLRKGQGLYVPPSADFVPYIYPPLYPWVLSLLGEPSYFLGRLLSILGTLAAMGASVAAIRQERISWPFALAPVLLYATCYEDSGAFFDLVRSDALALGLAAWAMVLVRRGAGAAPLWGGVLLTLAFMAKHNYAALGVPMVIWLWVFYGRKQAFRFGAVCAGSALAWVGWMHWQTDGLFLTYLLEVPSVHPLVQQRFWPGSELEVYRAMPVFVWASLSAAFLFLIFRFRFKKEALFYWCGLSFVIFGLCALMRAHHGGFLNVLMPGFWMLALVSCMLLGALEKQAPSALASLGLVGLLALHSQNALWAPDKYTPRPGDQAAGEELIARIRAIEGEVLMPHAPWYPALAGKEPSVPLIALWDIDHKKGPLRDGVQAFREDVSAHRWEAIITPGRPMRFGISKAYVLEERLRGSHRSLRTKSGWPVSLRVILKPKATD